ncbi:MAG: hypothetical protein ACOYIH_00970 [Candidatus Fimadaptatus sp.]
MRRRTALARFIDAGALWAICAVSWAYYLARRAGSIYAALPLAIICAAATIALWALLARGLRALKRRKGSARTDAAQTRALCEHMALMDSSDALNSIAAWLKARGRYAHCSVRGGAILARRADGSRAAIALISAWPGECASTDAVICAWRRCKEALEHAELPACDAGQATHTSKRSACDGGQGAYTFKQSKFTAKQCASAANQSICSTFVISTAPLSAEAQSLSHRLGIRLISPQALAELMVEALPLCGEFRPRGAHFDALRAAFQGISAGRMGAWALGLCVGGRLLGLPYCRAIGLMCALIWLLRAAQPRGKRTDTWG